MGLRIKIAIARKPALPPGCLIEILSKFYTAAQTLPVYLVDTMWGGIGCICIACYMHRNRASMWFVQICKCKNKKSLKLSSASGFLIEILSTPWATEGYLKLFLVEVNPCYG